MKKRGVEGEQKVGILLSQRYRGSAEGRDIVTNRSIGGMQKVGRS
jgi:hypothetical protein